MKKASLLRLLSNPATWAIIVVNCVNHWGWGLDQQRIPKFADLRFVDMCLADSRMFMCSYFIYLNWMPTYFSVIFDLDVKSSSYFSFLPWTVSCKGVMLYCG